MPRSKLTSTGITASSPTISTIDEQLSPGNLPLPAPSPELDDDSELSPIRLAESTNLASTSAKPIIHQLPFRSRNHSPSTSLTRSHSAATLSMPLMQRAHSSPGVDSTGRFITPGQQHHAPHRPSSPLSAGRRRSPLRGAMEESYPVSSWSGLTIEPNIPENEELDLSDRLTETDLTHLSHMPTYHNTFPRSRRRPTSPLHASASTPSLYASARAVSPHTTGTQSPMTKYYANEAYPTFSFSSVSSMPSTPSSLRSRSPSISSLDTIEDTPDLEEAAEEESTQHRSEEADQDSKRRNSLELRANSLRSNKERKRWSVCGAERRADFSLEVIEE